MGIVEVVGLAAAAVAVRVEAFAQPATPSPVFAVVPAAIIVATAIAGDNTVAGCGISGICGGGNAIILANGYFVVA